MEREKFSVLMSTYAKENAVFLDLAMESVLAGQELPPDEFVLVCDGPLTDELYEVIEKYEKAFPERLKVCRRSENVGLGKALNYGLSQCSYDLVARADSDDICVPERFEKQVQYMSKHPEVAVLGSDICEFADDPTSPSTYKKMPRTCEEVLKMSKSRNPVNHMTAIFRKAVIEEVGSYMHLQYVEDYYMWVRVLAAGYKIENLNEPLVLARVGNGMVQRRGSTAQIGSWKVLNSFMLSKKMINRFDYAKNMISIYGFVHMPASLRGFCYRTLLRK